MSTAAAATEYLEDPVRSLPGFTEEALGILIHGRRVTVTADAEGILAFVDAATAMCTHERFVVVPLDDFSRWDEITERDEDEVTFFVGVGIAGGRQNGPGRAFSLADVRAGEALAAELLGDALWEGLGALPGVDASGETFLALVTTGVLPTAKLVYGEEVEVEEDDEAPEGVFQGRDLDQVSHATGIQGERVAFCDRWGTVEIDLSDEAHAERAARLPDAAYHVVVSYD